MGLDHARQPFCKPEADPTQNRVNHLESSKPGLQLLFPVNGLN
jgi:hypothetical protein